MRIGLALAALALVIDRVVKLWLVELLTERGPMALTPFFNIVYARNAGMSFSLFSSAGPWGRWVLLALSLAIVFGLLIWLRRAESRWLAAALGLIIGGALGNALDRLRSGFVEDFFDFHAFGYHWPAFNVADMAIFGGVAFIVLDGFAFRRAKGNAR